MPRPRDHIVANLEQLYREAYERARAADDPAEMARLDFEFRRDQLYLESILDVRDLLGGLRPAAPAPEGAQPQKGEKSVLEEISELRGLARLPFRR